MAEPEPTMPARFTADLAALLRSLPPIDEEFLRTVEELTRAQPFLKSLWDRGSARTKVTER